MSGNPEVIARLDAAYRLLKAIEEQAHLQEHWLEATGWKTLSDAFDCVEEGGHKRLIHPLMKRVNQLGGRLAPGYAFEPAAPVDAAQIDAAYRSMMGRLDELHRAFVAACDVAERVSDYVTESLIWSWQEWVEKQSRKFAKRIGRIEAVGMTEYLAELMD